MTEWSTIGELVTAAARGEQAAWNRLVERYLPLVYSVLAGFRLSPADAQDVNQTLWLRLLENLENIRDPRALPGWISVTTRNEALRVLKAHGRVVAVDPTIDNYFDRGTAVAPLDENLLRSERRQVIREALAELAPQHRELLLLLTADPPIPYREISERLGIPVGSIGPTRARCLQRLRDTAAMTLYNESMENDERLGGDRNAEIQSR